ncbi:MAG: M48 family metallopeptidase [Alphaproteobacteria bacterium]|nr:M48 family metallopeptidase [Alphaproteobacteria bacterium]MDA8005440.1 M48 family metallopeptidase [Alphaproteobacteria bacterium]MDA8013161.1 M48 family metallopeptidase [Alphaproteobacteria bacterium]
MPKSVTISLAALATLALSACVVGPTTQAPTHSSDTIQQEERYQRQLAFKQNLSLDHRLQTLSWPILAANTEFCGEKISHALPVGLTQRKNVAPEWKDAWADTFPDTPNPVIHGIWTEDTPLQINDEIISVSIDGEDNNEGEGDNDGAENEEDNTLNSQRITKLARDGKPLNFTVKRDNEELQITTTPVAVCDYPVILENNDALNAYATGHSIHFFSGFMKRAPNDLAIAVIVGHELAHNTRDHVSAQQINTISGAILGGVIGVLIGDATDRSKTSGGVTGAQIGATISSLHHSQGFENEADYIGLYHTARAGYDITNAADLWRWFAANTPGAIGLRAGSTHPSSVERYLNVDAAVAEIARKKSEGLPLVPDEGRRQALSESESDEQG